VTIQLVDQSPKLDPQGPTNSQTMYALKCSACGIELLRPARRRNSICKNCSDKKRKDYNAARGKVIRSRSIGDGKMVTPFIKQGEFDDFKVTPFSMSVLDGCGWRYAKPMHE